MDPEIDSNSNPTPSNPTDKPDLSLTTEGISTSTSTSYPPSPSSIHSQSSSTHHNHHHHRRHPSHAHSSHTHSSHTHSSSHSSRHHDTIDRMFNRTSSWRAVFVITFILRIYMALSTSYIHPDEHFQGPEAVADKVFGWATKLSWEFTSKTPVRSYLSIWLAYGLPMTIFQTLLGHTHVNNIDPNTIFLSLRLAFATATWSLTDMAIDRLSDSKSEKLKGLFFVATSYVTWTYQSHTFSNSVETVILLWCLVIIHEFTSERAAITATARHWDICLLGIFIVLGTFNRVTFPVFIIIPILSLTKIFYKYPLMNITFIASLAITTLLAIYIDTILYGVKPKPINCSGLFTRDFIQHPLSTIANLITSSNYIITPLNNFLYNTQLSNLSIHGLHSKFQHIFANLPQLLGPGILFLFSRKYLTSLPLQSAIGGTLILSLIPHQEPRFLIPTIPLFCLSFDSEVFHSIKLTKLLLRTWLIFNLLMGILMGYYHQAGIVPAQSFIRNHLIDNANTIIWWKTYSPPIWLLGQPIGSVQILDPLSTGNSDYERYQPIINYLSTPTTPTSPITVVDLMGAAPDIVHNIIQTIQLNTPPIKSNYFIAPTSTLANDTLSQIFNTSYTFTQIWSTSKHISMEALDFSNPSSLKPGLKIWEIKPSL